MVWTSGHVIRREKGEPVRHSMKNSAITGRGES
jgi:hypothetical protein